MVDSRQAKIRSSLVVTMLLALSGCGAPARKVVVPMGKGAPVDPSADDPGVFSVISPVLPSSFVLDGDIREWGNIEPSKKPPEKGKPPEKPVPVPVSHVAMAFHSKGLAIAAELSKGMGDSILIALAFDRPGVPEIGYFMRGGGIKSLPCFNEEEAATMDPEDRKLCQLTLDNHTAFTDEYTERFRMLIRIQPTGASVFRGVRWDAAPDIKVVMKPAKSGHTLEVALPAKVLPRALQAPVNDFFTYIEPYKTDKPVYRQDDAWDMISVAESVGFEPFAELRAAVFAAAETNRVSSRSYKPNNLSYQPGDGLEIEDVDYDGGSEAVSSSTEILYSKQATMGDVEVGYTYAGRNLPGGGGLAPFVSLYKGKPVQAMVMSGKHQKIVERDGELHIFAFWEFSSYDEPGSRAEWNVMAVDSHGELRGDLLEPGMPTHYFTTVGKLNEPDYSSIGIVGVPADAPPGTDPIGFNWTYDKAQKIYAFKPIEEDEPPRPKSKKPAPKKK